VRNQKVARAEIARFLQKNMKFAGINRFFTVSEQAVTARDRNLEAMPILWVRHAAMHDNKIHAKR
jgi:hypothetical protein